MARSMRQPLLAAALLLCALSLARAQFGMGGMGGKKEEKKEPAVKADLPFIRCQVCEKVVKQAIAGTAELKKKALEKPGNKLQEDAIIDMLENMCNPDKDAGEWVSKIDLQEDGDKLKLVEMEEVGVCNTECRTVARACEQITDKLDLSDLSEMLYAGRKRAAITSWACYEQGSSCRTPAPPVPEDREPGPAFQAVPEDELRNKKLMRAMKEAGLSGQMYDRDSMAQMAAGGGGDDYGDDYGGGDGGGGGEDEPEEDADAGGEEEL